MKFVFQYYLRDMNNVLVKKKKKKGKHVIIFEYDLITQSDK